MARPKAPDGHIECDTLHGGRRHVNAADLRWRVSVYGVAVDGAQVLLGRSAFTGKWDIPGGGVEPWETLTQGLVREFYEETGVKPEPGELLHLSEGFFSVFAHAFHSLRYYFRVRVPRDAALTPQLHEVTRLDWVDPLELDPQDMARGDLDILRKALGV